MLQKETYNLPEKLVVGDSKSYATKRTLSLIYAHFKGHIYEMAVTCIPMSYMSYRRLCPLFPRSYIVFMPIIPAIIGIQRHKEILLLYAFECPKIIMLT